MFAKSLSQQQTQANPISLAALSHRFFCYTGNSEESNLRKRDSKGKTGNSERSHGSIFLRIGAIAFGLGTMIYNGIEFGSFLETRTSPCYSILLGVNPILQATFTFAQMYFIFTYSRLMIHKFKLVARLGLMHLVATNICTWIRTLGKETVQEFQNLNGSRNDSLVTSESEVTTTDNSVNCQTEDIMAGILKSVSPYLYPFIVEYSLIGAAFLYIMWSNIGREVQRSYVMPVNGTSSPRTILSSAGSPVDQSLQQSSSPGFVVDNLSTSSSRSVTASNHSLYSCLGSSKGAYMSMCFTFACSFLETFLPHTSICPLNYTKRLRTPVKPNAS